MNYVLKMKCQQCNHGIKMKAEDCYAPSLRPLKCRTCGYFVPHMAEWSIGRCVRCKTPYMKSALYTFGRKGVLKMEEESDRAWKRTLIKGGIILAGIITIIVLGVILS